MTRLIPEKLKVHYPNSSSRKAPKFPRRYTLTHSDRTGNLFLTIGTDYDYNQIKGWYTRLMRDEILAELILDEDGPALHVYCQVVRGLGSRSFREAIFRRELDLVLEAIRYGDREFFDKEQELDESPVLIHFCTKKPENDRIENWGPINKYAVLLS
ncbi:MAG: staygreen family protein [Candidatus Hermodarchaeota archaeon]